MAPMKKLARALFAFFAICAGSFAIAQPAAAQGGGMLRDSEIEQVLREFCLPVWRAAELNPDNVDIYIVSDSSLNAFVAGGENIFVNTGLILSVENPNQLIGVLAHETGHITGGHLARSRDAMQRSMGPALISIGLGVLALIGGAPDAGAALISGAPAFAMGNFVRHTQVQESAADQAALTYLEASGQSGEGIIDLFNRQFRRYEFDMRRAPPYLVSHPFSSDRVQALRERAEHADHFNATDTPENVHNLQMIQAKIYGYQQTLSQTLVRYPLTDRSKPARYARAFAYYRTSDVPRASQEIQSLIADEPNNPFFYEIYGQLLFENGRAQEAVAPLRRANALKPDDALLMVSLARALAATEPNNAGPNTTEAVRLLERATALEPDNAFGWRELASAHDKRGEGGLARLASAEQSYVTGDYGRAVNFAERAKRELPNGQPAWQRANDIVTFSQSALQEAQENRGRRS
ncbi:MAG: M48 family metalloprotease [Caulobacterales bacterium]